MKTNGKNMQEITCWICHRNRKTLKKIITHMKNKPLDENLYIEIIKNDLYVDAGYETIKLDNIEKNLKVSICVICADIVRVIAGKKVNKKAT